MSVENFLKLLELSIKNILNLSKILFTYYFTKQITGNEPSANVNDTTINFVLSYAMYFVLFYVVVEMIEYVLLKITSRFDVDVEYDFILEFLSIDKIKNRLKYALNIAETTPSRFVREDSNIFAEVATYSCSVFVVFLQLFLCTYQYKFIIIAIPVLLICYISFVMTHIMEKNKQKLLQVFDEQY